MSKLSNKELTYKYTPLVKETGIFVLETVTDINHRPHPFMIGPRHISHATDHHYGVLGEATLKAVPCAHPGCKLPYESHISDKVMALKLIRNATNNEAQEALKTIVYDNIDGFVFIKTEFDFIED